MYLTVIPARTVVPNLLRQSMKKEPSAREQQVLSHIAQGKTSKQIAVELGISLRTVNTHRENIAKKIGSSSLAAMIRYAIEYELKGKAAE